MKNKIVFLVTMIVMLFCFSGSANAQVCEYVDRVDYCNSLEVRERIKEAVKQEILEELTIWTHPRTGEITYSNSCANQNEGCESHVDKVVNLIFDSSCENGLDPFDILAIAKHESNYNPFAINKSSGAVGLLQLMPRNPFARGIKFIHNPNFRESCRQDDSYCQEDILSASYTLLNRSIARCGTRENGIGMYGSGSCDGSKRFVRFVNRYSDSIRLKSILRAEEMMAVLYDSTRNHSEQCSYSGC